MCARGTDNCLVFVYLQTDDGHMNGEGDGSGPAPAAVKKWQFWKKKSTGSKKFGWIKGVLVSWFIKRIEIPYFLDFSVPLFSSRPRIDRAGLPRPQSYTARPRIDCATQREWTIPYLR